jgi:hypothetical protein
VADVIPLIRVKTIAAMALAERFPSVEKSPPKARELRPSRPASRIAGREADALAGFSASKFVQRVRRNAKLRFFRIFKLIGEQLAVEPKAYRPVAERMRIARFLRRL